MNIQNLRLSSILVGVALILLIPFIAMQFTDEVNWTPLDFIAAGVLLLGTGLAIEIMIRKVKRLQYRIVIGAAILLACFVIWAELAVGLIGTPLAGH
jgi:hypothetical protein